MATLPTDLQELQESLDEVDDLLALDEDNEELLQVRYQSSIASDSLPSVSSVDSR